MASVKGALSMTGKAGAVKIATVPIQSSFIAALEYDQQNMTLTTHLKSGAIYQHKFVLPNDWTALQTSKNPSKHWADQIRGKKASVRVKSAKSPRSGIKTGGRHG